MRLASYVPGELIPLPLSGSIPELPHVAKVFLGCRTKVLRATGAFCAGQCEGPYRLIQNPSWTSVVALKSDTAAEKPKDQLSRDFPGRSVFDFCNNIGTNRTSSDVRYSVANGAQPDIARTAQFGREW